MVWSSSTISNRSAVVPAETDENNMLDSILARLSPLRLLSFRWTMGSGSAEEVLLSLPIMAKELSAEIAVMVESTIRIFFTGVAGVVFMWLIVMHYQLYVLIVGCIELPILI